MLFQLFAIVSQNWSSIPDPLLGISRINCLMETFFLNDIMASLHNRKPDLDDGIREEVEVLIEEHERLIDAERWGIPCRNKDSGGTDPWKTEDSIDRNNKGTLIEEVNDKNQNESANECNGEGIEVSIDNFLSSVDNNIDKNFKRKYSHFSRAYFFKSRRSDPRNSPPPPLELATTFDTTTTLDTEQSTVFEEEDSYRDSSSTSSRDNYQDGGLISQTKEFSRTSSSYITTIIEEQHQKRERIKKAEIEEEQEKIDEALHLLQDENESGTDVGSEGNDALEWLEMEVEHNEVVSQIISEMNDSDDKGNRDIGSGESENNAVVSDNKSTRSKGSRTQSRRLRLYSHKTKFSQLRKRTSKTLSKVSLKQRTAVSANEDHVGEEVKTAVTTTDNEKPIQLQQGRKGSSSSLVKEKAIVPESEEVIDTAVEQEEQMINASQKCSPHLNSIQLPTVTKQFGVVVVENDKGVIDTALKQEEQMINASQTILPDVNSIQLPTVTKKFGVSNEQAEETSEEKEVVFVENDKVIDTALEQEEQMINSSKTILPDVNSIQLPTETKQFGISNEQAEETSEEEEVLVAENDESAIDAAVGREEFKPLIKSVSQSVEIANRSLSSTLGEDKTGVSKSEGIVSTEEKEIVEPASKSQPGEKIVPLLEEFEYSSPSVEETDNELSLPIEEKQSTIVEVEHITSATSEEPDVAVAPPPNIGKPIQAHEKDQEPQCNPEGVDHLPLDQNQEHLSISELLSFDDHREARGTGPIDLDEVHDRVEQVIETQTEGPVLLSNQPDPSYAASIDEQDDSDNLPCSRDSLSPPKKACDDETTISSESSLSLKTFSTRLSFTSSASMCERSSGVHGGFVRLKHIVFVGMVCMVVGIWVMQGWFDLQAQPNTVSLPEPESVVEEAPKRKRKKKERKRKQKVDIDELLFHLW